MPTSWRMNSKNGLPKRCAMFSLLPVNRLSTHSTSCPACSNASQRCEPRNPAPPVTRTFFMMVRPEDGAAQPGGETVETLSDDHDSNPSIQVVGVDWRYCNARTSPARLARSLRVNRPLPDAKPELQRDRGAVVRVRRDGEVRAEAAVFGGQRRQGHGEPVAVIGVRVAVDHSQNQARAHVQSAVIPVQ